MIPTGTNLFVRIDEKSGHRRMPAETFQAHLDYLKAIAADRPFAGGGFIEASGGMILFQAENFEEAHKISREDPVIKEGFFSYTLKQWEVLLASPSRMG